MFLNELEETVIVLIKRKRVEIPDGCKLFLGLTKEYDRNIFLLIGRLTNIINEKG